MATPIEKMLESVEDWTKSDTIIKAQIVTKYQKDFIADDTLEDSIAKKIAERKQRYFNKVASSGVKDSIILPPQDLVNLDSNEFDKEFGDNFLLASSDNWRTMNSYLIMNGNEVTSLRQGTEGIMQLSSSTVLNNVLWPLFQKQKQNILDKLQKKCPFEQEFEGHMPFDPTNFANEFQDCMSSWILEHFKDIVINFKYKPKQDEKTQQPLKYGTITEFTEVFAQHSKDSFVLSFVNNLPLLCGRYAKRLNDHPLPYSYNKDDYAFVKLDIDNLVKEGPCPLWDKALTERLNSEEECAVFRSAIWQVYEMKNRSRQVIYLYDAHGRSGKSAMLRVAFKPLSQAQQALQKKSLDNQFAFAKIWDKQLVTIGDNKSSKLLKTQLIHTATGGDYADVEYKGKNSFSAYFKGHIWANGNVMLDIDTDAEHEVSRLVLFKINKPNSAKTILYQCDKDGNILKGEDGKPLLGAGDPSWEDKLEAELPQFLYKCKQDYAKYCPRNSDIILPKSMQDLIQEECSELNQIVFEDFLSSKISCDDPKADGISDADFREVWNDWKEHNLERYEIAKSELTFANLTEHMSKLGYGIRRKKLKSGARIRLWPGIRLNDSVENSEE